MGETSRPEAVAFRDTRFVLRGVGTTPQATVVGSGRVLREACGRCELSIRRICSFKLDGI